jgi:hypothetical protein
MERHSVDETTAFQMLREHSRSSNRRLIDIATGVVEGHRLLPKQPQEPDPQLANVAGSLPSRSEI